MIPRAKIDGKKTFAAVLSFKLSSIHFPWFGAIRWPDYAFPFHLFDHSSRTIVSYAQSPLNHRDRRLLGFGYDGNRLIVHFIVFFIGCRSLNVSFNFKDLRTIMGACLLLDEFHYLTN